MDWNRRDFIVVPAAAIATSLYAADPPVPWQRKIRRIGQTNMTEHDPAVLDVEQWADYWASLKVDAVMVSVTGILAFYQTKVPYHRKGKFLGDRDFFGECCAAAKKRGIHVIARMSPDLNWEDAVQAHPEWFQRDAQGNVVPPHRGPAAVPHVHVHHLHDRLHAGDHEGDQLSVRRGWPVHQRVAAAGLAAGLLLRAVPEAAAGGHDRVLGEIQRAHRLPLEAVRFDRQREECRRISISPTWAAESAARPTW